MSALTDSQKALALNLALHAGEAHILAGNEVCAALMKEAVRTIRELVEVADRSVTHDQVAQVVKELQDGDTADSVSEERKGGYQAALEIVGYHLIPELKKAHDQFWIEVANKRKKR
jgi:hemerythrin